MFDNILGQDEVVERLADDVRKGQLPAAMLYAGPEYSGKLSTALELARILTCTESADWACTCRSCAFNRELIHPRFQLLGSRYFVQEILTCGETLRNTATRGTAYLYLRAVRKLLRRLDPILWEGEEARVAKALESLAATEEALEPIARFASGQEVGHRREAQHEQSPVSLTPQIDSSRELALKTLSAMPADLVPVATIRRLTTWLRSSAEGPRVIIIENVDQLGEASINALLKMLEEPPEQCWFILTTSRRGAVLPTILSRARDYRFRERPQPVAAEVIRRVFRGPSNYNGNIRDYFLQQEFPGTGSLRSYAERFLESAILNGTAATSERTVPMQHRPDHSGSEPHKAVTQALANVPEREALRHFLQELLKLLGEILRAEEASERFVISRARLASWRAVIQEHYERSSRLNMRLDLLLHSLYYRMRSE